MTERLVTTETCLVADCPREPSSTLGRRLWTVCRQHVSTARLHHIEQDDLVALFDHGCEVCGRTGRLSVDHDHRCCAGKWSCGRCIRGALCNRCNMTAGLIELLGPRLGVMLKYLGMQYPGPTTNNPAN